MRPFLLSLALSLPLAAQSLGAPATPTLTGPTARIVAEVKDRSEAFANLEYLSDVIGPRLTGSERLLKAQAWAMAKLKAYGAVNVREEAYDFGKAWTRGVCDVRLASHARIPLQAASFGWGPNTQGVLKAEVLNVNPQSLEELKALPALAKGKILMVGAPPKPPAGVDPKEWKAAGSAMQKELLQNIAGMLMPSNKKEGKLAVTGGPEGMGPLGRVPTAFLSYESHALLKRLLARNEKVELELNIQGTFSEKPVQAHNVLGELRGSEKPDEIVVLGAHLDSWDLGTGTTDNGTGVTAVLEAFRALAAQKTAPKRTIRVVLFSGEEQGLYGSKAYVKAHAAELPKHQAVLIEDSGPAAIKGWNLQGREDARPLLAKALADANDLGLRELSLETHLDSDHAPFVSLGVPAFFARKDYDDYMKITHHSQVDTLDFVKPENLVQNAQALALTAWNLANLDERLPHRKPAAEGKPTGEAKGAGGHSH